MHACPVGTRGGGTMESWKQQLFRELPKVDEMLAWPEVQAGAKGYPRWALLDAVRETLERRREQLGSLSDPAADSGGDRPDLADQALALLAKRGGASLRPVINASGHHRAHEPRPLAAGPRGARSDRAGRPRLFQPRVHARRRASAARARTTARSSCAGSPAPRRRWR